MQDWLARIVSYLLIRGPVNRIAPAGPRSQHS